MKIVDLKKREDFDTLAELSHKMVQAYDKYDRAKDKFCDILASDVGYIEKPMAVARRLEKYRSKEAE